MRSPVQAYNDARIAGSSHDEAMVQAVNELIWQVRELEERIALLEGDRDATGSV